MWWLAAAYAVKAYGQYQANQRQAEAERQNASYFREQADYIQASTDRSVMIFQHKKAATVGAVIGAYASGGIGISGAVSEGIAGEEAKLAYEEQAIKQEGAFRKRLALLRAGQAEQTANSLTSAESTFATFGGAGLDFAANSYGRG